MGGGKGGGKTDEEEEEEDGHERMWCNPAPLLENLIMWDTVQTAVQYCTASIPPKSQLGKRIGDE